MNEQIGPVVLGDGPIGWRDVVSIAQGRPLALSDAAWTRIRRARKVVLEIAGSGHPHYGINTGLGALCHVILGPEDLHRLSRHTLMSHACGIGEDLRPEQVRAIIACAVINFSHGFSGIDDSVVAGLIGLLEHDILPRVPARGSVGYLSHMAHIGLALIGEGPVDFRGQRMAADKALQAVGMAPLQLGPKDGLSLVNGTPAMTGLACVALAGVEGLAGWADAIGAMTFEVLGGQLDSLHPAIIAMKKHPGVQDSAAHIRAMLADSEQVAQSHGVRLQDALSIRSVAQVHGACRDQLRHAAAQIEAELNSATDNPLVIEEDGKFRIVSQSNCHGESVAMACDLLAIATAEWGGLSERRCFRLVTPQANDLPAFLSREGGVRSGMMIAQYSASSLAADNRRLAQPAVVDNFLTSGLQEDHVSLGDSAALKLDQSVENAFRLLAIEYVIVCQAQEFITPRLGHGTARARALLRRHLPEYADDRPLADDLAAACRLMQATDPAALWA